MSQAHFIIGIKAKVELKSKHVIFPNRTNLLSYIWIFCLIGSMEKKNSSLKFGSNKPIFFRDEGYSMVDYTQKLILIWQFSMQHILNVVF
jgi:hypothetical protein